MSYCGSNPPYYITAYGLARKAGFTGTLEEWLNSLTAYGLAQKSGFEGTEAEWLESLVGPQGPRGQSAYEYAVEGGYEGTEEEYRDRQANTGKSAYEYAVAGGYKGTIEEFSLKLATEFLPIGGGMMTGAIDMGSKKITNLPTPEQTGDAVNKEYADAIKKNAENAGTAAGNAATAASNAASAAAAAQSAANAKATKKTFNVTLTAANWNGSSAPYTQTVTVSGILAEDEPHWNVTLSGDVTTKLAQKEGFACVDDLDTAKDSVTFTCLEEKPKVDLNIRMEVIR